MYYPLFDDVRQYARTYSTIPVCRSLFLDTETPISLYQRVRQKPYSFLLESAEEGGRWGRYSFIGTDPFLIFQCTRHQVEIMEKGKRKAFYSESPFDTLDSLLEQYRSPCYAGYPPFLGGAVGYVGFDAITTIEPSVPRNGRPHSRDIHLMFCDRMIVVDHLKQEWSLVVNLHVDPEMAEKELWDAYHSVLQELDRLDRRATVQRVISDVFSQDFFR